MKNKNYTLCDKDILNVLLTKNGGINNNLNKILYYHPDIKNYLDNRFPDEIFSNYHNIIKRIQIANGHNLNNYKEYKQSKIDDSYILDICLDDKHRVQKFCVNKLIKNQNAVNYLRNRFDDSPDKEDFSYIIKRIRDHIEVLPKCPICGEPLLNYNSIYCGTECQAEGHRKGKKLNFYINFIIDKLKNKQKFLSSLLNTNIRKIILKIIKIYIKLFRLVRRYLIFNINKIINKLKVKIRWLLYKKQIYKQARDKWVNSMINIYGEDYQNQLHEKAKMTNLKRGGHTCSFHRTDVKDKVKDTFRNKYHVDNYFQLQSAQEDFKQIKKKKYNDPYYCNPAKANETKKQKKEENPDFITKAYKETCLRKYNCINYSQTEEYRKTAKRKYFYNNLWFDSSWELAFYIYHRDKGYKIEREPYKFKYISSQELHYYFPDFKVNEKLYEIKGDNMLDENNHLIDIKTKQRTQLCIDKEKCMIKNNVIMYTYKDIKIYLKYINDTYGKNYLKQFKIRKDNKCNDKPII